MKKYALGFVAIIFGLTACTAHYYKNSPISEIKNTVDFSLEEQEKKRRSEEILLLLTFSGGGTRAAAFSYGVLEVLAETVITVDGEPRRLLDEVDGISAVSGGSFTAAYYGLFGDRIFEDFESKFLTYNIQAALLRNFLSPQHWFKLWSRYYSRSDLASEYYDEVLFEKKTFRDFDNANTPLIAINATDVALGSQFTFSESQFAQICSELVSFPVSRAVTASSAVPGTFPSVILKNFAGSCDYQLPKSAINALNGKNKSTRRYNHAKTLKAYQNTDKYPYIHLVDGGVSDNLGIRTIINTTLEYGGIWKTLKDENLEETKRLIIIAVNSRNDKDVSFAKTDYPIPFFDTLSLASSVSRNHYSFETMELLRDSMEQWQEAIRKGRCPELNKIAPSDSISGSVESQHCNAQTILVEVSFDAISDESEREYIKNLPTSFALEADDVDRLRKAARQILKESDKFQEILKI